MTEVVGPVLKLAIAPAQSESAEGLRQLQATSWNDRDGSSIAPDITDHMSPALHTSLRDGKMPNASPFLIIARASMHADEEFGRVMGWIAIGPSRSPGASPTEAEIWSVCTWKFMRLRKIAKLLWLHALEHLKDQRFDECEAWAPRSNRQALRFLQSIGMRADPLVPVHADAGRFTCSLGYAIKQPLIHHVRMLGGGEVFPVSK
jgi:ribosomal protein S18 acetylase RimI-like enzyme